jgi:hypothetical protein
VKYSEEVQALVRSDFLGPITDVTFSASASFQSETAEVFHLFHLLFITL